MEITDYIKTPADVDPSYDWKKQCENPIVSRVIKPGEKLNFLDLPMAEQIEKVAKEYNSGLSTPKIEGKLGIGSGTLYNRINAAREKGLIKQMRAEVDKQKETKVITAEDITEQAKNMLEQAQILTEKAERLKQAGTIALAITELLGEGAYDLVSTLYERVCPWNGVTNND